MPSRPPVTDAEVAQWRKLKAAGYGHTAIADLFGRDRMTVRKRTLDVAVPSAMTLPPIGEFATPQVETFPVGGAVASVQAKVDPVPVPAPSSPAASGPPDPPDPDSPPVEPLSFEEKPDGTAVMEFISDSPIRTEAEAVAHGGFDMTVWYVSRVKCGAWTGPVRGRQGQGENGRRLPDKLFLKQYWKISLTLDRILPKPFHEAHKRLFEELKAYAPAYTPIRFARPKTPHLLEIDLFDVHFGKLAWAAETGQDYDLKLAEAVFRDAVEDILNYYDGHAIDQVIVPVGNDFFHVDNLNSTTTKGTPVDSDGRYPKIIATGTNAMVWAVELLMQVAPVTVLYVPGNHDRIASFHLCHYLEGRFHKAPGVTVDVSPTTRKYFLYGKHLFGYTHGHREPLTSLPGIMATERPHDWAKSLYREWRRGHQHKSKAVQSTTVDTHDGVIIRTLQSLSGKDEWSFSEGYAGGRRAAEGMLTAKDTGNTMSMSAVIREGNR